MITHIVRNSMLLTLGLLGSSIWAEEPKHYVADVRMYRILGGSTGNSSRTLLSTSADIVQIIHEKFDGVDLDMDGKTLTWNGAETPSTPIVQPVGFSQIEVLGDQVGKLRQVSKAEYFDFKDGQWTFGVTDDPSPGTELEIQLTPGDQPGVLANSYEFKCWYIKERAPLPGVTSLNVGKPVIKSMVSKGEWLLRPGEWSCLRTPVPSQGNLYVFLRVAEVAPKLATPEENAAPTAK